MSDYAWWQEAVFYQIYPRSFADGNGDGIGDFGGMIGALDYLQDLGIDAVWLSPHYPSPQVDCGYDVSDYTGVAPEYGTLEDFKAFLAGAHARGIRVILDMVLNHTSDQHPWFLASRSSRDNPFRNWYVWRDGRIGPHGERLPPNNWEAAFTGSAWEYDPVTDQYYYHYFLKEQPDLNWRNPQVRQAMWDAVRFWLDLGVDGFRLDAVGTIFEDPDFRDHESEMGLAEIWQAMAVAPPGDVVAREALQECWRKLFARQVDLPEVHDLMKELRCVVDEYPDCMLVGESDDIAFYGNGSDELHLVFNFPLMRTERLTPPFVRANQAERLGALPPGAWPCNTLGNHDSPRVWSHFGDGVHDRELAQLSLALILTLKGTPFLYYGEEIGMENRPPDDLSQFRDTLALRIYDLAVERGLGDAGAFHIARQMTRDSYRTPMQWRNAPNAGFCPAEIAPWLPVHSNYARGVNVEDQMGDAGSLWRFYQEMLRLRKQCRALRTGEYEPLLPDHEDCLVFLRTAPSEQCLVVLNFSDQTHVLQLDSVGTVQRVLYPSGLHTSHDLGALEVAPFGIYLAEVARNCSDKERPK